MKTQSHLLFGVCILFASALSLASTNPQVVDVIATQRADQSAMVDIYYDLICGEPSECDFFAVDVCLSDDGGSTWGAVSPTLSGDTGPDVKPGFRRHVTWDCAKDLPGVHEAQFKVRVTAKGGAASALDSLAHVPSGGFLYQATHWIDLGSFAIGKYEITNQQYLAFLNSNSRGCHNHWYPQGEIRRHSDANDYSYDVEPDRQHYPVTHVSYSDAQAYIAWRSSVEARDYRLPSEEEWEKAAGWDPTCQRLFAYGFHSDDIDCDLCNYAPNWRPCVGTSRPVGSYPAQSYYGCCDMSGNIMEWTNSLWVGNPGWHIIRGGAWGDAAEQCRTTWRFFNRFPEDRYGDVGFRVALDSTSAERQCGIGSAESNLFAISTDVGDALLIPVGN